MMNEDQKSKWKLIRVAVVDRFPFASWYTWYLTEELRKFLPKNDSLYLYAPKRSANRSKSVHNFKSFWSPCLYPIQIAAHTLRDKINILHLQFEPPMFGNLYTGVLVAPLLLILKLLRIKLIVTIHGPIFPKNAPTQLFKIRSPSRFLPPWLMRIYCIVIFKMIDKIADAVIVHAHVFKKWLREQGIKHCYVIPHGIEVVRGTPSNCSGEHKLILCFGVISPRKGINNLILAFSKIKDELPNYKLIIAGGEPIYYNKYLNTLKFLVRKQGIEDRVIFTGRVEEDDIGNLFNKASFVVIPYPFSTSASGPLAMAMGFGKPIIVTSTEYFSEVLEDGKDALLVPPEDSEGLANAILRLSKDEALRKDLSYHVRSKAKKYRWGEIAEMTYDVYNNILWGRKV